jgi:acyl-CoA reductase-like NAD-dependent aldehyde dehydrogenase
MISSRAVAWPPPSGEAIRRGLDRIVAAMVVAGLRNAIELAELATEETGFGVFEDKVLKNCIATEFLYDYLRDKKSAGGGEKAGLPPNALQAALTSRWLWSTS